MKMPRVRRKAPTGRDFRPASRKRAPAQQFHVEREAAPSTRHSRDPRGAHFPEGSRAGCDTACDARVPLRVRARSLDRSPATSPLSIRRDREGESATRRAFLRSAQLETRSHLSLGDFMGCPYHTPGLAQRVDPPHRVAPRLLIQEPRSRRVAAWVDSLSF